MPRAAHARYRAQAARRSSAAAARPGRLLQTHSQLASQGPSRQVQRDTASGDRSEDYVRQAPTERELSRLGGHRCFVTGNSLVSAHSLLRRTALSLFLSFSFFLCVARTRETSAHGFSFLELQGKDIENKCNAILSKLKLHSNNELPLDSNKTPSMVSFTPHSTSNVKKRANRKQLSNRLSMYSMDTKVSKSNPKQRTSM